MTRARARECVCTRWDSLRGLLTPLRGSLAFGRRSVVRRQTRTSATPRFLDLRLSERATYTALTPTWSTYMPRPARETCSLRGRTARRLLPNGPNKRARLSVTCHYTRQRSRARTWTQTHTHNSSKRRVLSKHSTLGDELTTATQSTNSQNNFSATVSLISSIKVVFL